VVVEDDQVSVADGVVDLESFRRWVGRDDFPETGRICYFKGEVWIDLSWQEVFSHNQLKTELTYALVGVVKARRLGRFFPDGLRLTSLGSKFSVVPAGTFVSTESLRTKRVQLVEAKRNGYIELEGIPDMVLEVVSPSSVKKDTVDLRELFADAGIPECWLVDARREPLRFEVLHHTAKGYVSTRKQAGWLGSGVFGQSFRLTQQVNDLGHPEYTLEVR
jgi:Uma2 family endonuclease